MKGRIQILDFKDDADLHRRAKQLKDFCKLLKLQAQKVQNRHYDNIFFVQLSKNEAESVYENNALLAYCSKHDHVYDLMEDGYPGF
jgi:hypothetical protein